MTLAENVGAAPFAVMVKFDTVRRIAREHVENVGSQFLSPPAVRRKGFLRLNNPCQKPLCYQHLYTELWTSTGHVIKSPQDYPIRSPYVSTANRQAEIMMPIASGFGVTPRNDVINSY